jgi:hypothetical protein
MKDKLILPHNRTGHRITATSLNPWLRLCLVLQFL